MKICLYSPYVPKHIGGGEKYFFDVARVLAENGHEVSVGISGTSVSKDEAEKIRQQYEKFLNHSLAKVDFIPTPLGTSESFWKKLWWTNQFDCMYYATDGSLFFSLAKRNIVHIQIPFIDSKSSFVDRLKLLNWQVKNTNSLFTKKVIEQHWRTVVHYVHYPMIEAPVTEVPVASSTSAKSSRKKEKIILHVGRFFRQQHSKRQDILVEIFHELIQKYPKETKDWKMVLIGSVEDQSYADEVAQQAKKLPIEIIHSISRTELENWYQRASIYWHATGYGLDEMKEPAKMEHFGISTVEAMIAGDVPVVIGMGGQVEVLGEALKDLLWKNREECIEKTVDLIRDPKALQKYSLLAQEQAKKFNKARFTETLLEMINDKTIKVGAQ